MGAAAFLGLGEAAFLGAAFLGLGEAARLGFGAVPLKAFIISFKVVPDETFLAAAFLGAAVFLAPVAFFGAAAFLGLGLAAFFSAAAFLAFLALCSFFNSSFNSWYLAGKSAFFNSTLYSYLTCFPFLSTGPFAALDNLVRLAT